MLQEVEGLAERTRIFGWCRIFTIDDLGKKHTVAALHPVGSTANSPEFSGVTRIVKSMQAALKRDMPDYHFQLGENNGDERVPDPVLLEGLWSEVLLKYGTP